MCAHSAAEVLQHPWILAQCEMDIKDSQKLNSVPGELTKYVTHRRKLQQAMNKIRVVNAMAAAAANAHAAAANAHAAAEAEAETETKTEPKATSGTRTQVETVAVDV